MPIQNTIRDMHRDGHSKSQIARVLSIDRKTVRKYIQEDDFSPKPPAKRPNWSVIEPYKERIDEWLEADRLVFYKQRHTAKRIFERLRDEENYPHGYGPVQRYVKKRKEEMVRRRPVDEPLDLIWEPGSMQVDFGQADFDIKGERTRGHYLTMDYPHSNFGLTQVFGGEAAECVCQGLKDAFEYVGSVPSLIVFDNATGIGRRVGETVVQSELFARFRAHYGFMVRFCNVASGHEKGAVERKVAYHRKNLFVPIPAFDRMEIYNQELLDRCLDLEDREHYRKGILIHTLLAEDIAASLSLPAKPFDCVRYEHMKADGYGYVTVDSNHVYSSSPALAHKEVMAAVRAHTVEVLNASGKAVATHRRRFGKGRTESIDAASTVLHLSQRPGAWMNSSLRAQMPASVVERMDELGKDELKRDLALLAQSMERSGIDATFDTLDVLASEHDDFPDFFQVGVLAARIVDFGLTTAPEPGGDLEVYDDIFLAETVLS